MSICVREGFLFKRSDFRDQPITKELESSLPTNILLRPTIDAHDGPVRMALGPSVALTRRIESPDTDLPSILKERMASSPVASIISKSLLSSPSCLTTQFSNLMFRSDWSSIAKAVDCLAKSLTATPLVFPDWSTWIISLPPTSNAPPTSLERGTTANRSYGRLLTDDKVVEAR